MYSLLNANAIKLLYNENQFGKLRIGTRKTSFLNKINFYIYEIKVHYNTYKNNNAWVYFRNAPHSFFYLSDSIVLVDTGSCMYGINFDTPIYELDERELFITFQRPRLKKIVEQHWNYWWIPGYKADFKAITNNSETSPLELWKRNAKAILRHPRLSELTKEVYLDVINETLKEKGYDTVFTKEMVLSE